jgi:hypothetical protein
MDSQINPLIGKVLCWKTLSLPAEDIILLAKRIREGTNITKCTLSPRAEMVEAFGMIIDIVGDEVKVLDFSNRKEYFFPIHMVSILTN